MAQAEVMVSEKTLNTHLEPSTTVLVTYGSVEVGQRAGVLDGNGMRQITNGQIVSFYVVLQSSSVGRETKKKERN